MRNKRLQRTPLSLSAATVCLSMMLSAGAGAQENTPQVSSLQTAALETLRKEADRPFPGTRFVRMAAFGGEPGQLRALAGGGQLGPLGSVLPFRVSIRVGAQVSPRSGFAGGVDVTIPSLHLLPGFTTRVDGDIILTDNKPFYPVTFSQFYSKGLVTGQKVYIGGGLGLYIGEVSRFGGKVFVGANITGGLGAEATVHFPGIGDPLITVQVRWGL